jgi:surface polysaccharide O-acyltransferase-like enzyme
MTTEQARRTIIALSLVTTTLFSCALIISPLFIQLKSGESLQLVQNVFPVFAGYIGASVLFLFRASPAASQTADNGLLELLVYSPFGVFWLLALSVLVYFYISNLPGRSEGMTFEQISTYITLIISFMNATTGALTALLFNSEQLQRTLGIKEG